MKNKYELLSPVGNFAMLSAAVQAGADAVYFGLQDFNMRAGAKNFKLSDLPKMKKICSTNSKKVKMYLTLNTIIYPEEFARLERLIKKLSGKIDAIICWDFATINLCKKYKIPFHVSTQASVSNEESAKFYEKLGAKKIVLARELSLEQIKKISKVIKTELECFVHGAMCVSISGRCFISQFLQGRSANRGECTQPCRRSYKVVDLSDETKELVLENNKVMSAKDLCTIEIIDLLKKSGVRTFKIEGRNRSPEYVYTVTNAYRKALDKTLSKKEIDELVADLKKVYNRGFSSGFYLNKPTEMDFSKSENGEQTEKKTFVGTVKNYYKRLGVGLVQMSQGPLRVGDSIFIIGNRSGVIKSNVESIEIKNKKISKANKGDLIGIKLPECRIGDEVYLISEKKGI